METEKAGYTIDVDVPCSQCGYNLRGLEVGGTCPECGRAVGESLIAGLQASQSARRVRDEDRPRINWWIRGCFSLLAAITIFYVSHLMPSKFRALSSIGWELTMVAPWAAWGLTWLGMVFLSVPTAEMSKQQNVMQLRMLLWITITIYALYPALPLFGVDRIALVGRIVQVCGVVAAFTFYRVLMNLADLLPSKWGRLQFELLGLVVVGAMLFASNGLMQSMGYSRPTTIVARLCSPVFGYHLFLAELLTQLRGLVGEILSPALAVPALTPIWAAGAILWLMGRLRILRSSLAGSGANVPDFR